MGKGARQKAARRQTMTVEGFVPAASAPRIHLERAQYDRLKDKVRIMQLTEQQAQQLTLSARASVAALLVELGIDPDGVYTFHDDGCTLTKQP